MGGRTGVMIPWLAILVFLLVVPVIRLGKAEIVDWCRSLSPAQIAEMAAIMAALEVVIELLPRYHLPLTGLFPLLIGYRFGVRGAVVFGPMMSIVFFLVEQLLEQFPTWHDPSPLHALFQIQVLVTVSYLSLVLGWVFDNQRLAYKTLYERKSALRAILDHTPDIISRFDAQGRRTFVSEAIRKLVGVPPEQLIGKAFEETPGYSDDFKRRGMQALRATFERGEEQTILMIVALPEGNHYWNWRLVPEFDQEHRVVAVLGISQEITREKLVEERLRESEERLRLALEATTESVWDWHGRTGELFFSNPIWKMLGYPSGNAGVDGWLEFLHPDDLPAYHRARAEVLAPLGSTFALKARYRHQDGSYRLLQSRGKVVERESSGEIGRIVGTTVDITAGAERDRELHLLHTAIEQAPVSIMITDADGRITFANPMCCSTTGFSHQELIGASPTLLKSGKHDRAFFESFWNTIRSGKNWSGTMINKKKGGELFEERMVVAPGFDSDGKISHFVRASIDVTLERRMEQRMQQAQKMQALGTMAAGIAHDFNNILMGVIGFTEMAQEKAHEPEAVRRYLEKALVGTTRATELVKQILIYTQNVEHEVSEIDLAVLATEMSGILRTMFPSNIAIERRFTEGEFLLVAAPSQVRLVIMNLATNAFHAMRQAGGVLTIELSHVPEVPEGTVIIANPRTRPEGFLRLVLQDTGAGIPERFLGRIFEPFFTTKSVGEGSGMGLPIVQGIVTQAGGHLLIASVEGKGTRCEVYFPAKKKPGGMPPRNTISPGTPSPERTSGHERIWVVDDDDGVRRSVSGILEFLGYSVTSFSEPSEVLNLLINGKADVHLVLTDQSFLDTSGCAFIEELRKTHPDLLVVLMTGASDSYDPETAKRLKIAQVLLKPLGTNELGSKIREVLDSMRSED